MVPKHKRLLGGPSAIAKHPAETFMALHRTASAQVTGAPVDQPIADSLMVSLAVIVTDVFGSESPTMAFGERNHLADTLFAGPLTA